MVATRFLRRRKGISEVFGALMLILIVVVVVAGIAVFISQTQQQAQARQNFQDSVKNDNLQIVSTDLSPSDPSIDFQLTNTTDMPIPPTLPDNSTKFYVSYFNESAVKLYAAPYDSTDLSKVHVCDLNASSTSPTKSVRYSGNVSLAASLNTGVHVKFQQTSGSACSVTILGPGSALSPNYKFSPATWDKITISVRNANIQTSGVFRVGANDNYVLKWYEQCNSDAAGCSGRPIGSLVPYNTTSPPLVIPAQASTKVILDYSDPLNVGLAPQKSSSLKITILSPSDNFFKANYLSPSPVAQINAVKEDYSVATRDLLVLDASQTTFGQAAFAQQFTWQIDTPVNNTWSGSWTDTKHVVTKYLYGKTTEYRPESLFNTTEISKLRLDGPLRVTLKAVDNQGLSTLAGSTIVPEDPNLTPIGNLNLAEIASNTQLGSPPPYNTTTVFVKVLDIFGRPVKGTGVTFSLLPGTNETAVHSVSTFFNVTNSTGITSVKITWTTSPPTGNAASYNFANIGVETSRLPTTIIPARYLTNYP